MASDFIKTAASIIAPTMGRVIGYGLALFAVAAWGFNFVIARGLREDVPPLALAFLRWAVAAGVLLPLSAAALWRAREILRRRWRYFILTAASGVGLFHTLIYIGAATSPAANLSLIAVTSSLFVLACAPFVGERITARRWAGALIALFGLAALIGKGDLLLWRAHEFAAGDLWMLLAAAVWALYTLLLKRRPREINWRAFHAATVAIALVGLTPFFALSRAAAPPILWDIETVIGVAYLGLVASIVCYYCWDGAVGRIGVARAAMVYYLLPVFAATEAALILEEEIAGFQLAAMALIIGGVALSGAQSADRQQTAAQEIKTKPR
jgi:drug/metabolite transporter (DMT)-like permease